MKKNKRTLGIPTFRRKGAMFIKAHEATGHVTMREHVSKMENAVNKAIQGDERFAKPPTNTSNYGSNYQPRPFCVDCTTPDDKGNQHAIIHTSDNRLVRHPFEYDETACVAKMCEGEPKATESTRVYAHRIEQLEGAIKARAEEIISCRVSAGTQIDSPEKWEAGKPVSFIYVPAGDHTITAGFRKGETITCTIRVNEDTAKSLQDSFDFMTATETQEPYGDEDHEGKKATLRFPTGKVKFKWGTLRGKEGVIVEGAEPTSYGAECANGKIYTSWSGEFASDISKDKIICKKKHNTIPDGERGSKSNPAEITDVNFVVGAMTNQPAFHKMPKITAKDQTGEVNEESEDAEEYEGGKISASGTSAGVKKSWEKRVRGAAHLAMHLRSASEVAHQGGGHYIASIRDGLKGTMHHMQDAEHRRTIQQAIDYIQDRVTANNEANKKDEEAAKKPDLALKEKINKAESHIREKFSFGTHPISKNYGEPSKIGGVDYQRFAAEHPEDEKTGGAMKAADKTAEARNSESSESEVQIIFASQKQAQAEVDAMLLESNPAIKHRKMLEEIFSQSGS